MKSVTIKSSHPFFEDFEQKLTANPVPPTTPVNVLLELAKQWYGYDIILDDYGTVAQVTMSDAAYTLWLMKWSV